VSKPSDFGGMSLPAAMSKIAAKEGVLPGFYSGFGPILFKQVPLSLLALLLSLLALLALAPSSSSRCCSGCLLYQHNRTNTDAACMQIPYTMAKFAVQGIVAEKMYDTMGKTPKECSGGTNLSVSLGSGVVAGVIAAIISHPADTLLSKVNKPGAGGEGSAIKRMGVIAAETGYLKLCTQGLAARCIMVRARTHTRSGIVAHDNQTT
jgi:hypothetical protein